MWLCSRSRGSILPCQRLNRAVCSRISAQVVDLDKPWKPATRSRQKRRQDLRNFTAREGDYPQVSSGYALKFLLDCPITHLVSVGTALAGWNSSCKMAERNDLAILPNLFSEWCRDCGAARTVAIRTRYGDLVFTNSLRKESNNEGLQGKLLLDWSGIHVVNGPVGGTGGLWQVRGLSSIEDAVADSSGRVKVNLEPLPNSLLALISPP